MSDDLHNIDDLFKKGLEDHVETPSGLVWENIDKNLDKKKVVSILKKYNKLKWAAAILLLFSSALAMYTLHVSKRNMELVKQNNEKNFSRNKKSQVKNNSIDSAIVAKNNIDLSKSQALKTFRQNQDGSTSSISKNNGASLSHNNNIANNLNPVATKHSLPGKNLTAINNTNASNKNEMIFNHKRRYAANLKSAKATSPALHLTRLMANNNPAINNNQNQKQILNEQKLGISTGKVTAEVGLINKDKNSHLRLNNDYENKPEEKLNGSSCNVGDIKPEKVKSIESTQLLTPFADASEVTFRSPELRYSSALDSKFMLSKKSGPRNAKSHNINNAISSLSATVFFSPDRVSTNLRNEDIRFSEEDRREIEKNERNNFSSTFGVLIDYKISKKLSLQSGINFSSWITHIHPRTIYARPDNQGEINYRFNCVAGYSYFTLNSLPAPVSGDSLQALNSNNTLQYVSVPFMIKYTLEARKFDVVPGIGLSANFLTKGQIKTTIATNVGDVKASSNSIEGLKPLYFSGLANIAFQYNFNKAFSFALIPTARFSLSSINKNAPVKTNLYSVGFAGALVVRL
jgi:hypothetical protein